MSATELSVVKAEPATATTPDDPLGNALRWLTFQGGQQSLAEPSTPKNSSNSEIGRELRLSPSSALTPDVALASAAQAVIDLFDPKLSAPGEKVEEAAAKTLNFPDWRPATRSREEPAADKTAEQPGAYERASRVVVAVYFSLLMLLLAALLSPSPATSPSLPPPVPTPAKRRSDNRLALALAVPAAALVVPPVYATIIGTGAAQTAAVVTTKAAVDGRLAATAAAVVAANLRRWTLARGPAVSGPAGREGVGGWVREGEGG